VRIDVGNVQGLVVTMYRRPVVRHLLFRFGGGAEGRAFVQRLLPEVTMGDALDGATGPCVNLGITYRGLQALGVEPALVDGLSSAFREGPDARRLGDVAGSRSAPANWWEGRFRTEDLHCIVHLHVRTDAERDSASAHVRELARDAGMTELIPRADGTVLDAASLGAGKLHFGYTDGITRPDISWDDAARTPEQLDFREFVLGYGTGAQGAGAAWARDGSYGVFRWIYQDVATFNRFLHTEGPRLYPERAPADAEELLAAKLMGRWRDGTPLVLSPDRPDEAMARRDDFGYERDDPDGHRCPFSAHIRVVNPRDQRLHPVVAAETVPRVVRRGMPYGPVLEGVEDDGRDRGLIGMFVCGDLMRQLYTLTNWVQRNDFSPVFDANGRVQDALVANRAVYGATPQFTVPGDGREATVTLPDFVHTKGTAFLLYPSKSTLLWLSGSGTGAGAVGAGQAGATR
jgi:deferrochelatase/peroxidase EfeB